MEVVLKLSCVIIIKWTSVFNMFGLETSWQIVNNVYLLFDYVHLMKSIRNNWLTEKVTKLSYDCWTAKWEHIKTLWKREECYYQTFQAHRSNQNVSLCLKVLYDQTTATLKPQNDCPDDTTEFLTKLFKFVQIAHVKSQFEDVQTKDEARALLSSPDDERLNFLISLADMVETMSCQRQGVRDKQLTKDTTRAFSHTCRGIVGLTKHLLQNGFSWVCLRHFPVIQLKKCLANSVKVQEAPTS